MGCYVSGAARNWRVFSPGEISQQHVEKLLWVEAGQKRLGEALREL